MAKLKSAIEEETDSASAQNEMGGDDGGDAGIVDDDATLIRVMQASISNHGQGDHYASRNERTGRVMSLSLGTILAAPFDHHWDLSPMVQGLAALESLTLTSCKNLPEELVQLKSLRKLTLIGCKRLDTFPRSFHLMHQLQELRILGIGPMIPPYILSQIASLPDLHVLQFSFHSQSEQEELRYLQELLDPSLKFASSLRELILNRCHIGSSGFNFLLLRVVPNFPQLKSLSLCKNNITSFQGISSSITKFCSGIDVGGTDVPAKLPGRFQLLKLEELILSENPIWGPLGEGGRNAKEISILDDFLANAAPRLGYLGYHFDKSNLWSPQIEHWLDVNSCGRCLIVDTAIQGPRQNRRAPNAAMPVEAELDGSSLSIPIALWAIVLSRANTIIAKTQPSNIDMMRQTPLAERCASVVYYFLRQGPAMAGRTFPSLPPLQFCET